MSLKDDLAKAMHNKDLSDPVERNCFVAMMEVIYGALLEEKSEDYQKAMVDMIASTGPNKA